jgi:hypothetical protein
MTREDGLEKLKRLASRLGIRASDIRVRSLAPDSPEGIRLSIRYGTAELVRSCDTQISKDRNFACLVLWLSDLVRNLERRIETFQEAFQLDGRNLLASGAGLYGETKENLYKGDKTREDAFDIIKSSLVRLGLTLRDIKVEWNARGVARMKLRLPNGQFVEKTSSMQPDTRTNLVVLALWLQCQARNWERGIEEELEELFAANLLPAARKAS